MTRDGWSRRWDSVRAEEAFFVLLKDEQYTIDPNTLYVNVETHVNLKCPSNHPYYPVIPQAFRRGARCPTCFKIRTGDRIRDRAKLGFLDLLKAESYIMDSSMPYTSAADHVKLQCPEKHPFYLTTPSHFKGGSRCAVCSRKPAMAKRKAVAEQEFLHRLKREYYIIDPQTPYMNAQSHVRLQCPNKHPYYPVIPNSFKNGSRCPFCAGRSPIFAKQEFLRQVKADHYTLDPLTPYVDAHKHVRLQCPDKHPYYLATPANFKRGSRCPVCFGRSPLGPERDFLQRIKAERYTLNPKTPYKRARDKVELKCPNDHPYFPVVPYSFKAGTRCPHCPVKASIVAEQDFYRRIRAARYTIDPKTPYAHSNLYVNLKCPKVHPYYPVKPSTFKAGRRCPYCALNYDRLYIVVFSVGRAKWPKFGVAANYGRVNKHIRNGAVLYHEWHIPVHGDVWAVESYLKKYVNRMQWCKANQEDVPDGWTETFPFRHLQAVERMIDDKLLSMGYTLHTREV